MTEGVIRLSGVVMKLLSLGAVASGAGAVAASALGAVARALTLAALACLLNYNLFLSSALLAVTARDSEHCHGSDSKSHKNLLHDNDVFN